MAEGDHFVLSKGHAAAGLYATLCEKGSVSERDLSTFYQDGTRFPAHTPPGKIEHIRFGTGSLGHGLSLAAGIALGARMRGSNQNVFCVLSDGELNEGSTWEAALFASHHRLANVRVFVDANGLQGFGKTADVMNMEPLAEKWASFGFNVATCEGHHFSELTSCMRAVSADQTKPSVVIARTVKGKGVSYMENQLAWHYLPMSDEQFAQAKREVEAP
jgi:transketolase